MQNSSNWRRNEGDIGVPLEQYISFVFEGQIAKTALLLVEVQDFRT